ncbi:MAG: tRNA (N6-threonylcarbamoyladenosine(37)-N6)-methyltransferase TrmO [Steroidobacteraceae bacterium]
MDPTPARTPSLAASAAARLTLEPIGYARTALASKVEAARQPRAARGVAGRIELLPGRHFEHALEDLAGWEYLWVIYWFHLNRGWRPKVLPPRSTTGRKGVFATRAPHRPNPLGLSAVRLDRIEGLTLHVLDVDLVDGTPVLDIKPYVPYTDAHPQARSGWLDDPGAASASDSGAPVDPVPAFEVDIDLRAVEQFAWIEHHAGLALRERVEATLRLGPAPHPYRRIRREGPGLVLAIKDWRVHFRADGRRMQVHTVTSGYRTAQLARARVLGGEHDALAVHHRFVATFGRPP